MKSQTMVQKIGKITVIDFINAAITDTSQIQQITDELEELIEEQDQKYLLLDFSSVKFLSSQTMGMLLTMHGTMIRKKGWLGICGLRKDLFKAFKLTKLDKLFHFYKSEQDALKAVNVYV